MLESYKIMITQKEQQADLTKKNLAQYMTPPGVAAFMASLFSEKKKPVHLLDPGAGAGILTCAFCKRFPNTRKVTLFEVDKTITAHLKSNLPESIPATIYQENFIEKGAFMILRHKRPFSHVIINPPYKKISSFSQERLWLRDVGIETVNMYSGFVALSLMLLAPHGELVAIIPRSFCNGPYYKTFRKIILQFSAIRRIHLFGSRIAVFKEDKVLQENVIFFLERDGIQKSIDISTSMDGSFNNIEINTLPFDEIVSSNDEKFFRIPDNKKANAFRQANNPLSKIHIEVSTGPIVEFRMHEYLNKIPLTEDAPLLYPAHFQNGFAWPKNNFKKFNSIRQCPETLRWLYPRGWYVLTRRLSSKEEKRRIVAYVVSPAYFPENDFIGFENHFNVFHWKKQGLSENVAYGLSAYLNSARIDAIFRGFNGHTQVNATDLRNLPYPSQKLLGKLGEFIKNTNPNEGILEIWLEKELN